MTAITARWLLLAHQLPSRPSNARVKAWRRLQQIGAVSTRNSVYVLPNTENNAVKTSSERVNAGAEERGLRGHWRVHITKDTKIHEGHESS